MFSERQSSELASTMSPVETETWNLRMSRGFPAFLRQF